jgi:hypothetical protein
MNDKLHQLLADLRLKGIDQALDQELQRAEKEGAPAPDVIQRLLIQEQIYRQEQSQTYRLKQARS